jgi:hypothetical protein
MMNAVEIEDAVSGLNCNFLAKMSSPFSFLQALGNTKLSKRAKES